MANLRVNPACIEGHSKRYKPSVISSFLVERDDEGNIIRFNNDVKLLLRQKDLHKSIGYDSIRAYIDKLNHTSEPQHNLSDDELMSLIPPDGIDTITDAYQYNKYLDAHKEHIEKAYKDIQDKHKRYSSWSRKFNNNDDDKGD